MAIMLKTTARFLLLSFISFGSTLGNTVSLYLSTQEGKVGEPLELTCLLNPISGATITSVKWFLNSDTNGIRRNSATCILVGSAPSYDLTRYSFTCDSSSNTFKLKILALQNSDAGQCWSCSVTFSNFPETDKASSSCIKLQATTSTPTTTMPSTTEQDTLPVSLIIGVSVGGFIFILSIIIICCCCCCQCCCLYHSCRKKENKQNYRADFNEIIITTKLEMEPHIRERDCKMHQVNQLSDVIQTSTSQEQNSKLTESNPNEGA